jgi:hypothetical protein
MCSAPSAIGTINVGGSASYTGNLVPAGQEAYLSVVFTGNTSTSYHPHIRMTAGTADFIMDVYSSCTNGIACGTEGGVSTSVTDWETLYTAGDPTSSFNPIPPVGSGGTVIVHVRRRTGRPVTCGTYTIAFSN